ncbi:MAG: 30S ribosomal protein S17e [Thermoprotei archaeon]|nr:30S ribosomal protein S17e [Thermoprotei archaeon]
MGKVRPRIVKRLAKELLEKYGDVFKPDFEANKKLVQELTNIQSKRLRNRVAGYITHLVKIRAKREQVLETVASSSGTSGEGS